jgi:hypothetical protein
MQVHARHWFDTKSTKGESLSAIHMGVFDKFIISVNLDGGNYVLISLRVQERMPQRGGRRDLRASRLVTTRAGDDVGTPFYGGLLMYYPDFKNDERATCTSCGHRDALARMSSAKNPHSDGWP